MASYEELLALAPPAGVNARNEPQIITDRAQRDEVVQVLAAERGVDLAAESAVPARPWQTGVVFRDRDLTLLRDAVLYPDGRVDLRSRMLYTGAEGPVAGVLLLAVVHDRIVLVRQWRHARQRWTLEAPRGRLKFHTEDAHLAVARELSEELGARIVSGITPLGRLTPETGYISGTCLAFLAEVALHAAPAVSDEGDMFLAPKLVAFTEMPAHIASGEIHDALTLAAIARAVRLGALPARALVGGER